MSAVITSPTIEAHRSGARERPSPLRHRLRLLGIAAPGLVLAVALHFRSTRPMTMDESFTVLTSARSWSSLFQGCLTDPGMVVYYSTLKLWSLALGSSIEHLRWMSLVAIAAVGLGFASISERRGRGSLGLLAFMGFAMTPMVREASVDARAAAFGAALAVWLVVLFDRWLGDVAWPRLRIGVLLAGSVLVAFTHPSTLFAGVAGAALMLRFARRQGDTTVVRWSVGALGVIALGVAAASVRNGDAATAVSPGFQGIVDVLSQLPGGRALAGAAFVVTIGLLLAGRAYDDERIVRWFAGAVIVWFAAATVAFPVTSIFIPRYFVAAAALLLLALVLARHEDWSTPVIMATIGLAVVGGAAQVRNDYGFGSTWCEAADGLASAAAPGDRIVFGATGYASPVLGCLGEQGVTMLSSAVTVPQLSAADLSDPRALWSGGRPDPADLLDLERGSRSQFLWIPGADPAVDEAMGQLRSAGVPCTENAYGNIVVATCTNR